MVALCGAASAAELHVGTGQTYSTIQDAVDNATSGDTIIVHAGTYEENVKISKPSLTLRGEDRDVVTVTAADPTGDVFRVDYVDYVNISGFTVTGGGNYGIDIGANANHCNISDNNVSNNENGILLESSNGYTVIRNNIIKSNIGYGIDLFCQQDAHSTITGNDISGNEHGIYMLWSSDNTITGNRVHNNRQYGFYLTGGSINNTITCNVVRHNSECGFYLEGGSINNAIENNTIIENGEYGPATGGWQWNFHNQQSDDVAAENNYWGTADQAVIGASIKTDSGSVDYEPFNTSPCPCAPVSEVPASSAKELHVGTGQTYSTIQDAVNASLPGDTIIVHAGTYEENVMISTPALTLQGEGRDVVTVTAADSADDVFRVNSAAGYVNILGFTVTGSSSCGIRICSNADHCNISDNNVSNNGNSNNGNGILLESSNCYTVIRNNIVKSNAVNGINLQWQDAHNTITGNDISDNGHGIHMCGSSNNTITGNRVHDNEYGIYLQQSSNNTITCNVVRHNSEYGFYLTSGSTKNTISYNNIIENGKHQYGSVYYYQFYNGQSDDVDAISNWWGTNTESQISTSIYDWNDDKGKGNVTYSSILTNPSSCVSELHVGSGQAYSTIQDAVDNATSGDTIIVHAGTYEENVKISKPSLTLRGEDRDVVTVTAADPTGDVFRVDYVDYVNISGFTVTGGGNYGIDIGANANHCNISDNNVSNNENGILLESSNGYTVIRNNIIKSNIGYGIDLFCQQDAHSTITGNDISGNEHGIYMLWSSDNTITGNRVHNNRQYGFYLTGGSINNTITCNVVRHNSECGFYLEGGSINNAIENNTIIENGEYGPATGGWQWNFHNQQSDDVAAENNYWGTADQAVIGASIKTDSGSVDYEPFNTSPCPCAPVSEVPASSAKELHVGTGQTYSTIQDAVNASLPGDTIIVHAGTYEENVMISTPALTLQGEGRDVVTVTAADSADDVFRVNSAAGYVNILGFTVTGSSSCGIRICSNADHCNISDNNVSNNGNSNNGNGILLESSNCYTVIRNNIVKSNDVYGINLQWQDAHSTITGNDISDNGHGIRMYGSSNNTITGNRVHDNEHGIYMEVGSSNNTITGNDISDNGHGIHMYWQSSNNTITCNWVHNNSECGFYLEGGSINNTIENNTIIENGEYDSATGGWQWNFNNQQSDDVAAENNYWGTANSTVIDASIDGSVDYDPFNAGPCPCAPIPELPTLALCSIGLLALAGYTRMERKKNN